MAECHPVGFRWVMEAKNRGATIIHVDPRFTRTGAVSDLHVPIRAGSDIAFLGGIVRYILEHERYFKDYVVNYTNAATIIDERFKDTEDLEGLFSGWNPKEGYDPRTWQYEGVEGTVPATGHKGLYAEDGTNREAPRGAKMLSRKEDLTLKHPRCVFQLLKRHFSRYTPEVVEQTCGVPRSLFLQVAETLCKNSGRERTSAFAYAVGWTQHTVGAQYIRTAAIIQLLLGNMGRPGGGVMALRPQFHSRLDRHPYPLRSAARLSADAARTTAAKPRQIHPPQHLRDRVVERAAEVHRVAAEGLVRRLRDQRKRLRLQLAARPQRQPFPHDHGSGHGRRKGQGILGDGRKPDRRVDARSPPPQGTKKSRLVGGERFSAHRNRGVLADRS